MNVDVDNILNRVDNYLNHVHKTGDMQMKTHKKNKDNDWQIKKNKGKEKKGKQRKGSILNGLLTFSMGETFM